MTERMTRSMTRKRAMDEENGISQIKNAYSLTISFELICLADEQARKMILQNW